MQLFFQRTMPTWQPQSSKDEVSSVIGLCIGSHINDNINIIYFKLIDYLPAIILNHYGFWFVLRVLFKSWFDLRWPLWVLLTDYKALITTHLGINVHSVQEMEVITRSSTIWGKTVIVNLAHHTRDTIFKWSLQCNDTDMDHPVCIKNETNNVLTL